MSIFLFVRYVLYYNNFQFADYVGFIKKLMKLMQHRYPSVRRLEIELRQLEAAAPARPCKSVNLCTFYLIISIIFTHYSFFQCQLMKASWDTK